MDAPLLKVRDLTVDFRGRRGARSIRAVDGVSFTIASGETVGLVGESGSGKSTIGRAILGLTDITSGTVMFAGRDITHAGYRERRKLSAELQVVFQDPYSSLNPTRRIGQTLAESLRAHGGATAEQVRASLERVGLPADAANRYPANFSGGQRQRIAIARALMAQPRLVICDEPVSALDLSVQAQVLNLLHDLQRELGLSYLFVAHDLDVVRHLSHRIMVLFRGRVMEHGSAAVVYNQPAHPYTRALLDAAPVPDPVEQQRRRAARVRARTHARTAVADDGCPFASRCPHAVDVCATVRPQLEPTPDGTAVACHRWRELRDAAPHPNPPNGSKAVPVTGPTHPSPSHAATRSASR